MYVEHVFKDLYTSRIKFAYYIRDFEWNFEGNYFRNFSLSSLQVSESTLLQPLFLNLDSPSLTTFSCVFRY